MNILLAAIAFTNIICSVCYGTGNIDVQCSKCQGTGLVDKRVKRVVSRSVWSKDTTVKDTIKIACRDCFKGIYKEKDRGTGWKKKTCPYCKGKKFIRESLTTDKKL